MRHYLYLTVAILGATTAFSGQAYAANMCRAEKLTCATTMPVGGYCECTSHGNTESGSVIPSARAHDNSTAGGCGAHPNAPGCH